MSTQRSLANRVGAHASWAATPDPSARTEPARQAFRDSFERQIDPDGTMDPAERARRAEHLRKAHYARMALESAKARRAKAKANARNRDLPPIAGEAS